jgi:hypothetical protein
VRVDGNWGEVYVSISQAPLRPLLLGAAFLLPHALGLSDYPPRPFRVCSARPLTSDGLSELGV